MAFEAIIFLLLSIIVLILVAANIFLLRYFIQTNNKIDVLLEKGKKPKYLPCFDFPQNNNVKAVSDSPSAIDLER